MFLADALYACSIESFNWSFSSVLIDHHQTYDYIDIQWGMCSEGSHGMALGQLVGTSTCLVCFGHTHLLWMYYVHRSYIFDSDNNYKDYWLAC